MDRAEFNTVLDRLHSLFGRFREACSEINDNKALGQLWDTWARAYLPVPKWACDRAIEDFMRQPTRPRYPDEYLSRIRSIAMEVSNRGAIKKEGELKTICDEHKFERERQDHDENFSTAAYYKCRICGTVDWKSEMPASNSDEIEMFLDQVPRWCEDRHFFKSWRGVATAFHQAYRGYPWQEWVMEVYRDEPHGLIGHARYRNISRHMARQWRKIKFAVREEAVA